VNGSYKKSVGSAGWIHLAQGRDQ